MANGDCRVRNAVLQDRAGPRFDGRPGLVALRQSVRQCDVDRQADDRHAFYLAATALGGRSWEKLAAVWLKAFDRLRAHATFLDAVHETLGVAAALHGSVSAPHAAIKAGCKAVRVLA